MTQSAPLKPFVILGAGSWGTALALYLSRLGQEIRLWSHESDHIEILNKERMNQRYLPGHPFPASLHSMIDLAEALQDVDDILIAVPSAGFRDTLLTLKPLIQPTTRICWATKGLDLETNQLLHEVAQAILGEQRAYAVLSGPTFAAEVAAGLPTAIVAASHSTDFAQALLNRFNSKIFRVYLSQDITGVEIGGVVKNVLAVATGISDGMGMGANARCALITRGLAEMVRLGLALGGQTETFSGLAGLGDLVLTCTDDLSRNRRFGLAVGQGNNITDAERKIGQVVEGKRNAEILVQLAQKNNIDMPITETVWQILQGKLSPRDAMNNMLSRAPKNEM